MFQGAKNLDGVWTALGMDLIPLIATVNKVLGTHHRYL